MGRDFEHVSHAEEEIRKRLKERSICEEENRVESGKWKVLFF